MSRNQRKPALGRRQTEGTDPAVGVSPGSCNTPKTVDMSFNILSPNSVKGVKTYSVGRQDIRANTPSAYHE